MNERELSWRIELSREMLIRLIAREGEARWSFELIWIKMACFSEARMIFR